MANERLRRKGVTYFRNEPPRRVFQSQRIQQETDQKKGAAMGNKGCLTAPNRKRSKIQ